jgi:tyrosyl-tRNA synthetase
MGKILITDNPKVFSWIRNSDWFLETNDIQVPPGSTVTISDQEGKNNVVVDGNSFVGKAALFHNTRMQMTHLKNNIVHSFPLSRVIGVLRGITHARLIERDMFRERIAKGEELYMHEMLYPVLQGIDSSVIASIYGSCDLEIGGTDQTFNMLMGRDVMRMNKQPEQSVMSLDILEGLDGKEKMSKSLDNYVGISDEPNQMYGKIMSLPDELITRYFALTTYTPLTEVEEIEKGLKSEKLHPKEVKMRLAREIVAIYHGEKMAEEAEKAFTGIFAQGKIPESVLVIEIEKGDTFTITLVKAGCAESKSEARRLIESGAVTMMEEERKITDATEVPVAGTYRVGKHRFFKVK